MAKLPCVPQSRIFTLKDTGETMSYDQVRQYLMENPDIWQGAKEGKEVAMPISNALKDVESTAKALEEIDTKSIKEKIKDSDWLSKGWMDKQQSIVNELPRKKVNYKDIKKAGTLGAIFNNPNALNASFFKSAKSIYNDIVNGIPIKNIPYVNEKMELLDGNNRVSAQVAAGIEDIEVAVVDDAFYDYLGKRVSELDNKAISKAYHADKKAGKETELTKAVEDLLGGKEVAMPKKAEAEYKGIFNPSKTGVPALDDLLQDDGYNFFYKGVQAVVEFMSPDEYLKRVRKGFKETKDVNITEEKKDAIKQAIKEGNKINMPFLSTKDNKFSQEGRNRAAVAKEVGEEKIPVLVESNVTFDDKTKRAQELIINAGKEGAVDKESVLAKLKEQGLHRDAVRFVDDNFDNKAVEDLLGGEQKAEIDPIIAFLDKGKIKGVAGMNAALWNKAIDIIKAAYEAGKAAVEAVQAGIDFLKSEGEDIAKYQDKIDTITKGFENLANKAAEKAKPLEGKAVGAAVKKAAGVKNEVKNKVQKFIDKAFAIGSGVGFKEGVEKGTAQGRKAGLAAGKEAGFQKGFTKGATEGGKAGFVAGKEVGLAQGTEKGFTKGATEGMKAGAIEGRTQAVDMLRNALANLAGELTPKQISAIVERLGRLKTFSEAAKQRFIDYADKVIEDANYIAKEKKATEIKKAVKQMSKRPNIAANDQSLYKSFAALSISHLTPQDLDTYMDWGTKIKTKALQPGDRAELAAFIEQARQRQNAIVQERSEKMKEGRMRNLRAEFDEMQEAGTLPEGITTFDEYFESKKPKPKGERLEDKIEAVKERLREIPEGENKMIDDLRNVDLSVLSKDDLALIDNSLYNYIDTGNLYGIGDPLSKAEYLGRVNAAIEEGLRTRRQVDRKDVEILGMANLFSTIGETKDFAAKLRALLIQPWLSAATKANSKYIEIEAALMAKADKLKIKQPNWNRIDLFGFLNEGEDNPELFDVLRDQKLSDLETLRDRVAKNVAEKDNSATAQAQKYAYESLKAAIESMGLNENSTLESIKEKLTANELAFYNEMRKYLDQYSPKALENMQLYGNKEVGITKNYWPRTTNKITERPTGIDAFDLYGSDNVGKNMFGREKGRSRLLGKSGYYTPVGQENYFNGLKETMLIAEAAHEYHGMQALYNNTDKGYGQLIKGQGASDFKQLMIDYIMDTKNVGRYRGDIANVGADVLNAIQKGFTRSLINNPTQVPKQITALAYPFVESPKAFFKAFGLVLQGMVDGKNSPMANAINELFDTTTLGLRLYHPEMIDLKEKFTIDKPEILRNIQQFLKGFNKRIGGDLLPPTDKVISQIATLTGYIEQAERSGKKFNIFHEQAKGYDMVAAAAGEQMQSKTNNENAAIYFSKNQVKRRVLYYLSNFQANSVRNLYISVRKIVSARTTQEREEGFRGVAAYLLATSLFVGAGLLTSYAVNVTAFYLYQQIRNALGDTEDDEEERKRILKYLDSRQLIGLKRKVAGEIVSIAVGPYGLLARALVEYLSAKFEQAYYKTTEEEEKPSDRIFFAPEVGGYQGVVADNIIAPFEVSYNVNDPKAEVMTETGLLTAKFLGQSASNFYIQSLVNAKKLVEKETRARKEEKKELEQKAFPSKKKLAEAKKEWTKSIEEGNANKAKTAFDTAVKYSPYNSKDDKEEDKKRIKYITAIELRNSFYDDKVKPSAINENNEFMWREYLFNNKFGDEMIGDQKLKDLVPESEKARYIEEYKKELAKIEKMTSVMNKTVNVQNAYGKRVDWELPFGWVKQVKDKVEKK